MMNQPFLLNRPYRPIVLPVGAEAVYSTVRVNGYNGPCLRLIRSSDSAELDIGFGRDNFVDMSAANAFRGTSTTQVVKWYDQSGNGRDCVDTTTLPQFRSENVIGRKQPITMMSSSGNAGSGRLTIPTSVSVSRQSYTVIAVQAPGGGVTNSWGHFGLGTNAAATDNVNVLYDNTGSASAVQYTYDGGFNTNNRVDFSIPVGMPSCTMLWSDSSNKLFRLNGREISRAASPATTLSGGYIGRAPWSSATIGTNEFFMLAIYGSVLSAAQRFNIERQTESVFGVVYDRSGIVIFDGDSITAGLNNAGFLLNLVRQTKQLNPDREFYFDMAVAGQTMQTVNTNVSRATARSDSTVRNRGHIFAGTNDIAALASGAIVGGGATIFNNYLMPYVDTMQAAGISMVVGTMLPRLWSGSATDISQREAERLDYNSRIRSNATAEGYKVADYAALFDGDTASYTTGGGSVDGVHPAPPTYFLMAPVCSAALALA